MAESDFGTTANQAASSVRAALKRATEMELIVNAVSSQAPDAFSRSTFSKSHGISQVALQSDTSLASAEPAFLVAIAAELGLDATASR